MTDMTMWNEPTHTNALDTFQNRAVQRLADWAESANAAHRVAQNLVQSSFVPAQFKGKPMEATAAILSGLELGLQPMASLRAFDVIQNQAAPRAITLRAIVQSLGHEMNLKETTATRAVMEGRRKGETEWQKVTWTIDRAKQLGLTGKDNWKKQPQAMLVARATAELARLIAADAILGIPYTVEEIADGLDANVAVNVQADAPEPEGRVMKRPARKPAQEPVEAEPEPALEPDGEPGATKPQVRKIMALFNDVAVLRDLEVTRENRLQAYSKWAGRAIGSTNDLTKDEAVHVIDRLESWVADLTAAADEAQGELIEEEETEA